MLGTERGVGLLLRGTTKVGIVFACQDGWPQLRKANIQIFSLSIFFDQAFEYEGLFVVNQMTPTSRCSALLRECFRISWTKT
jgi:hypothetical protein